MLKEQNLERYKRYSDYYTIGGYVKRFIKAYITLLFVVSTFEVILLAREIFLPHSNPIRHAGYLVAYSIFLVSSLGAAIFLIPQGKKRFNEKKIAIVIHVYALIAVIWGLGISFLDFMGGNDIPVVFFTILATVGGLLVLNPYLYLPTMLVSLIVMIVGMFIINKDGVRTGDVINSVVLFIMIGAVSYRTTAVAVHEEDKRKILIKIGNMDVLTGLKNENAYYKYLDDIDFKCAEKEFDYAVIVMDLNGLKHVDDTYGHRFGAHLISKAGKILPTVFKNCEVFHTGGDEFVCVVVDEFPHLEEYLEDFANTLEYQIINFEGQDLVLSLARGVAIHKKGEKYNDTYQRADRDMYVNKPLVKQKHNIIGR